MTINLNNLDDNNVELIKTIKNSLFDDGHRYKQCYFESNKKVPVNYVCNLPCDIYCPNRIKKFA